jgi:hypothetical protein
MKRYNLDAVGRILMFRGTFVRVTLWSPAVCVTARWQLILKEWTCGSTPRAESSRGRGRKRGRKRVISSPLISWFYGTRWFKYDRDKLWLVYTQIVPVIFEPPCILLRYFLNYFEMVPVSPVITGITCVFTFHMRCISVVRFLGFRNFSASFLFTILCCYCYSLQTGLYPVVVALQYTKDTK